MNDTDFVEVYAAANAQEAHFVKLILSDLGIDATVVGGNLKVAEGELPIGWHTSPRVWVAKADEDRARQAVLGWEYDRRAPDDSPEWTCPSCETAVPGNFDVCWQCETPRA